MATFEDELGAQVIKKNTKSPENLSTGLFANYGEENLTAIAKQS